MNAIQAREFLEEAAQYFEKRDTGGEDKSYWSNVYNAENCRKIADIIERQSKILTHLLATEIGFTPFICGESGEKDSNGMPEAYHLCPAYGADIVYIYQRKQHSAPGW